MVRAGEGPDKDNSCELTHVTTLNACRYPRSYKLLISEIVRITGTTCHANMCSAILAGGWCSACLFLSQKASCLRNDGGES